MRTEQAKPGRPILVIDNGTHYLDQLQRALRLLGVRFRLCPGDGLLSDLELDEAGGTILTGGEVHVYEADQLVLSCQLIERAPVPILGLCLGSQLIAHVFDGTIEALPAPVD